MIEWYLETATDPEVTSNHIINECRQYFIGRKRGLDIITTNPLVSRNHGVITLRHDNSVYIKDTNSSNGIWVNNIKIAGNSDYLLEKGDLIGIGGPTTAPERPELYRIYCRKVNNISNCNQLIEDTPDVNENNEVSENNKISENNEISETNEMSKNNEISKNIENSKNNEMSKNIEKSKNNEMSKNIEISKNNEISKNIETNEKNSKESNKENISVSDKNDQPKTSLIYNDNNKKILENHKKINEPENKVTKTNDTLNITNESKSENNEKQIIEQNKSSPELKPNINDLLPSIEELKNNCAIEIIDSSDEETSAINIKQEENEAEGSKSFTEIKKEPEPNHSFTQDHDEEIIEINSDDEEMFPRSQLFDDVVKTEPLNDEAPINEIIELDSILDVDADQNDDSIFANIKKEENEEQIDEFIDDEDDDDGDEDDCLIWIKKLSQQQDIISCSQEFDRLKKNSYQDDEEEEDDFPQFDDNELDLDKSDDDIDKEVRKDVADIFDSIKEQTTKQKHIKQTIEDKTDGISEKSEDEDKSPERRSSGAEKWYEKSKSKKESKKTYVIPPVIEAPFLLKGKRRANEEPKILETKIKKRKPEDEPPQPSTSTSSVHTTALVVDKSVREEFKKRHKRRKSVDSMSRDEKQQIVEERKKKLKEIADKQPEPKKDEKLPKHGTKPKVKVSNSRGLFLTDAEKLENKTEEKKSTKEKMKHEDTKKKDNYKRQSSTEERSKKKYKIPKIDDVSTSKSKDKKEEHKKEEDKKEQKKEEHKKDHKKEEHKKTTSRSKSIDKQDEAPVKIQESKASNKSKTEKTIKRQDSETSKAKSLKSNLKGNNYVKKPHRVQFNDKIETKIFEREEPQIEAIIPVSKHQENGTITNEILIKILNWLPIWLQEQKKVDCCPPNLTERPPLKMFYHFNTAKDYYSIVTPLMLMELWRSIFKDWCNIRNPTILGSVDDLGDVPHMNNNIYLYCHSLTIQGNPDSYINRGDLAIVEIMLNNDRMSSNGSFGIATKFGYVKDVIKKRLTKNDRFNENCTYIT